MSEPLREPRPEEMARPPREPRDPEAEAARRNVLLGLGLFGLFVVLFGGTVVVALIYLALD